jgi:tRNA nucleotidyltransferase (CCA-adding enzyme)
MGLPELPDATPSQVVGILDQQPLPAVYAAFTASDDPKLRDLLWKYAAEWRKITPTITGHDLRKRGVAPGPVYKEILQGLRVAWLDGHIATTEEEARLLEQWIDGSIGLRGE